MRDYDKRKEEVRPFSASPSPLLYVPNSFGDLFQEAERQRKEAELQHEDEEGWVKVTRGSKVKARAHSEAVNKRTLQKEMKKKSRKELLNFYSWQHKNTQKERKQICCFVYLPSTAFENLILISEKSNNAKLYLHFLPFPDIAELRKKFEEDKQRIALLRAQRKFKPY